jgi:hypothetical protein
VFSALDSSARLWFEAEPPRDLEGREDKYCRLDDAAKDTLARASGRLQRISRDLAAAGGEAAVWSPQIDTLWRCMANRLSSLHKVHQIRRAAIHQLWKIDIATHSSLALLDVLSSDEMQNEKQNEFQLRSRILGALEVLQRAVSEDRARRVSGEGQDANDDGSRGESCCRYCRRAALDDAGREVEEERDFPNDLEEENQIGGPGGGQLAAFPPEAIMVAKQRSNGAREPVGEVGEVEGPEAPEVEEGESSSLSEELLNELLGKPSRLPGEGTRSLASSAPSNSRGALL